MLTERMRAVVEQIEHLNEEEQDALAAAMRINDNAHPPRTLPASVTSTAEHGRMARDYPALSGVHGAVRRGTTWRKA